MGCHLWGRRVRHDWSYLAAAAGLHVLYSRSLLVIHLNTAVCQIMYTENNLLKISLPIITSDNMKYSGTNLTNNVQDLYWKDFTMNHYINGRISTFIVWKTQCWKNVSFPQINLQFNKCWWTPQEAFVEIDELILKFIWQVKRLKIAKTKPMH